MTKKITFPHIGNYYIPIKYLIKKTTLCEVIVPPKITKKTIELGSKYSPDYVCVPFKYNLGNLIEVMACTGGCLGGNSTVNAMKPALKQVNAYVSESKSIKEQVEK